MINTSRSPLCVMKYCLLIIVAAVSFLSSIAHSADEESAITIAVVNVTFLLKNAPEAELASKSLKERFSPREKALADEQARVKQLEIELESNKSVWEEEKIRQRTREIRSLGRERTRAVEDFREELRFARDSALDEVQKSVFQAIEEVRVERKIDIVIQEYVAASSRVDLTPYVLEFLQAKLDSKQSSTINKDTAEK